MVKEMRKININIPVDTLSRIDEYAENMSINRTAAMLVLISQSLDTRDCMDSIKELTKKMKEVEKI